MAPLVSIIIPTFNGSKRIAAALQSVLAQDYENIEIILVDDVSTDDTVRISREVLESGGRPFKLIERTANGRQSASRNTGLEHAQGDYVIFIDHDDRAREDFVSSLCGEAERTRADLVFCGFRHFYENEGRYESEPFTFHEGILSPEYCLELWAKRQVSFWSVWNFIFRRDFLARNGLKFTGRCYFGEDTEFLLKSLAVSSRISFIRTEAYTYIHYDAQQSKADSFIRHGEGLFRQYRLSSFRTARFIARHITNKYIVTYARNFCIPDAIVKEFTEYAHAGDSVRYEGLARTLRHRKTRELLMSSVRFIFRVPELFFKSLMLLYVPGVYYRLRSRRHSR